MKRTVSLLICALFFALTLASCAKQAEAFAIEPNRVTAVHLTKFSDENTLDIDKAAFVEAYNNASVGKTVKDDMVGTTTDLILFTLSNDAKPVVLYYLGNDDFIVTGEDVGTPFAITSEALAALYNNAAENAETTSVTSAE